VPPMVSSKTRSPDARALGREGGGGGETTPSLTGVRSGVRSPKAVPILTVAHCRLRKTRNPMLRNKGMGVRRGEGFLLGEGVRKAEEGMREIGDHCGGTGDWRHWGGQRHRGPPLQKLRFLFLRQRSECPVLAVSTAVREKERHSKMVSRILAPEGRAVSSGAERLTGNNLECYPPPPSPPLPSPHASLSLPGVHLRGRLRTLAGGGRH